MRPPGGLRALALVAVALFLLPLVGLVLRVPWSDIGELLTDPFVLDALRISLIGSIAAVAISAVLGIPLAWALARIDFRGRTVVRALVTLPLVLPPVVAGTALLLTFGRTGFVGEPVYDATGLVLPFSIWAVIIANTFVAMPFLVITVEGALHGLDPRYEIAASSLGASRWTVLRRVTLPLVRTSLIAGLVLTWARAFGEFGATVTFAGTLAGRTQTMPLAVFVALQSDRDAAIAISLFMVVISVVVLVALRDRWWGTR
jgi:molybdate transport system permease protein